MTGKLFYPFAAAGLCQAVALGSAEAGAAEKTREKPDDRPNIVLIMCDDMGFSDLGCYGSEIRTPNIDSLASLGLRFSQFKNTARSCPSRASLLTGMYQHDVDMGWMTAVDEHRTGYRGEIVADVPTIAEVLRDGGYSTYMSGKWHLTLDADFGRPDGSYPVQRGFDRYYGCLAGGGSHWSPEPLYSDLEPVTELPDDYYYTDAVSDSAAVFIREHDAGEPMFLYVAYFAPHLPLEAPEERVKECLGRYEYGYDIARKTRFGRQRSMGIVPGDLALPQFDREFGGHRPSWEELSAQDKDKWRHDMATYAAMIEIMDDGVGRIVDALKDKGMFENTLIVFLSDNGATLEGGWLGQLMADLSNTPYRSYKQWCYQGGTSAPFIIAWGDPEKNPLRGQICNRISHITDIFPTCLDLASLKYPGNGRDLKLPGESLLPVVRGRNVKEKDLFFEHQGSSAVISGGWKLVRSGKDAGWELYNLANDPFETADMAESYPETVEALSKKWENWAEEHRVFPLEDLPWSERIRHYSEID